MLAGMTDTQGGRWAVAAPRRARGSLLGSVYVVGGLHLVGWGVLIVAVVPQNLSLGSEGVFDIGVGLTAYLLGVRHAFDADHIAVIDNTTRKLVGDGRCAETAGFWFALGHSSVVFGLSIALAFGLRGIGGAVQDGGSSTIATFEFIGTVAAAVFLILLGVTNLSAAIRIARMYRAARRGRLEDNRLEEHLRHRGLVAPLLGGVIDRIRSPRQLYPVGLLMGLGFDTASQVALLVLAAGTAAWTVPWYAILVLPVLFAAGMTLCDTADGTFMARAYGWSFTDPMRKLAYNLTVTALSVVVALVVGTIVLAGLLRDQLDASTETLTFLADIDLRGAGIAVVVLFGAIWSVAVLMRRSRRSRAHR